MTHALLLLLSQTPPDAEPPAAAPVEEAVRNPGLAGILALLLIGVALVGLVLIFGVITYGGRTRRVARGDLPDVEEPDPYAEMRAETRRNRRGRSEDDAADELL